MVNPHNRPGAASASKPAGAAPPDDESSLTGTARPDRRQFIKFSAAASIGAFAGSALVRGQIASNPGHDTSTGNHTSTPASTLAAPPIDRLRVGFVGVGGMGTHHLGIFLKLEGVEVRAVCDIREEHAQRAAKSGRREPCGSRPPTPPDVLTVSGGFSQCCNATY